MTPVRLRLREVRNAKGLSQAELAARAGLRKATVNVIERGKSKGVDFATLDALATALGVDPAILIVREGAEELPVPRASRSRKRKPPKDT